MKSIAFGLDFENLIFRPNNTDPVPDAFYPLNEISTGASAVTREDTIGSNHLTDNATVNHGTRLY